MKEGEILAGKYKLVRRLGEGGEGSVFLAIHLQTEMFRAIKEIRMNQASDETCICHELQMMKRLRMPHLPEIIDVFQTEESVFLVMEHVRGIPLSQRIKSDRPPDPEEVLDIAEQVTEALCYLERQNPPVCHLDIKPSNLIRRPDGLIKLVDFGSAWKEKEQIRRMVTDGYAAPEQYRTDGTKPDVRTDLFGLGATLYRIISGETWSFNMRCSCVPNCPVQLSDVILRCLKTDPSQRFISAAALKLELRRIRRKERTRKSRLQLLASLAVAFPAAALCLRILPSTIDLSADESWNYEKLIREAGVVSEKESQEYYRKAVFLEPQKSDAYLRYLLDAQTDGSFSREEELFLRDMLHSVRPGSDLTFEELLAGDPDSYLETAFQIGLAYWYNSPREDRRRIAMGWFEKAVEASSDTRALIRTEKSRKRAAEYLKLGKVLEKIHSAPEEDTGVNAVSYWEELNRIVETDQADGTFADPLIRLKLCRDCLQTITFLAGDLERAGIDTLRISRMIKTMKDMAGEAKIPPGREAAAGRIQEEIRKALSAAREAVDHLSSMEEVESTEDVEGLCA